MFEATIPGKNIHHRAEVIYYFCQSALKMSNVLKDHMENFNVSDVKHAGFSFTVQVKSFSHYSSPFSDTLLILHIQ